MRVHPASIEKNTFVFLALLFVFLKLLILCLNDLDKCFIICIV